MRLTTKVCTSLMKSPIISVEDDVDPWLQVQNIQTLDAAAKQSTSSSGAWARISTWSWGRLRRTWWHLASLFRSWEETAQRAWGFTTKTTTAFTRGRWGQGSTPQWHCPHAWEWWVWTRTESGCSLCWVERRENMRYLAELYRNFYLTKWDLTSAHCDVFSWDGCAVCSHVC